MPAATISHVTEPAVHRQSRTTLRALPSRQPQYVLPLASDLVIDLFAGGGGASTGIEMAIGRPVDIAVNHNPKAVLLHQANHPHTKHYVSDVFEVDPLAVTEGRPVGLLWASPDCRHFSKAKGGAPVSDKVRGLAWVVIKWAKLVSPRVIALENVEEFRTWGKLLKDGRPDPEHKGKTFERWVKQLQSLGYKVEWRERRACDDGAPTIRKRLFLIARRDGQPIVWPEPTHASPVTLAAGVAGDLTKRGTRGARPGRDLQPYRTAADCIDWTIPCHSIFLSKEEGRKLGIKRPLADATLRRIAHGVKRYVLESAKPFIVSIQNYGWCDRPGDIDAPLRTVTANPKGGAFALAVPTLITAGYGERPGQSPRVPGLDQPLGTVTAGGGHHALVVAFLAKHFGGTPQDGKTCSGLDRPTPTVTGRDHSSLVTAKLRSASQADHQAEPHSRPALVTTSHMAKLRGTSNSAESTEPLHTISAGGQHHAEVRVLLSEHAESLQIDDSNWSDEYGPTVWIDGHPYWIADISMRMLQPRELYNAQGFPSDYIIDRGADGVALTKEEQVRMCGNSVSPLSACRIVQANYQEAELIRRAA